MLDLLTDYDANGSFADMAENVHTFDGDGYAWYVRTTDLENPKPLSELKYVDESSYKFLRKTELHGGELLMAKRGDIGKVYIFEPRTQFATVAPNMYLLKLNDNVFPYFLYDYFMSSEGNKKLVRLNASSTLGALYKDDVKNIDVKVPSIEEQIKIGNYFKQLDNLITLHQRKGDETKKQKKYMQKKMFPKNGELYPQKRFNGFYDAWEQRKLNEYLEVSREKNKDEVFGKEDVLSVSGDYGIVNQIEFQGRSFAGVSVAPYGVVETGDVVYTKSPLKSNPYGIIKTNKGKPGIVSTLYAVYKPLDNVYSEFVQIYFEQDVRMNNYMHPLVNKGAKNDMKVSDENALKGEVCFPSRDEQIKISEYFTKLDNLITLHQHECIRCDY